MRMSAPRFVTVPFRGLLQALGFLTRIPLGWAGPISYEPRVAVPWFPAVGAIVAAFGTAALWLGETAELGSLLSAIMAVTVTALVTGGFHEDGLADSFDALSGGWSPEDRLRILKDSRHGTFGVLALVLSTGWKIAALAGLAADRWATAAAALVAAHVLGRAGAVAMMLGWNSASADGLGRRSRIVTWPAVSVAVLSAVIAAVAVQGRQSLIMIAASAVAVIMVGEWARRRIGGTTGDIFGAAEQVVELAVLTVALSQL